MPDGILPTETTAPELAAETADSRMVQHVRRNLVLWSGGTTLVILLILAAALYVAVQGSLASSATAQLDSRFDEVKSSLTGQAAPPDDDSGPYGFLFSGGGAGTIALAVDQDNSVLTQRGFHLRRAARHGRRGCRTSARSGCPDGVADGPGLRPGRIADHHPDPVRILTENVLADSGETYAVQIIGDRIAEQRTLDVMLVVLLLGGVSSSWWRSGSGRSTRDERWFPSASP